MLLVHGLADTSAVSLALALSASSSLTAGLLLLWAPLVVAETLWWPVGPRWAWLARLAERPTSSGESTEPPCDDALDEELVEDALLDAPLLDDELDEDASSGDEFDDELDDDVLQRTTRVRQDGSEWFIGQYRCHFEPGERTQTVHVVFCPPSHSTPELICTRISGPAAQIKPTQVQPYGARLEVRLSRGTHEPVSVVIAVHARLGD